jgi:hypothetical protein
MIGRGAGSGRGKCGSSLYVVEDSASHESFVELDIMHHTD